MNTKKTEEQENKREIVIPGEEIGKSEDYLPGEWTMKQGDKIVATRLGICDKSEKLIKIIPLSGVYSPRRGNVVIAEVKDLTMKGWIVDIKAPYEAFLTMNECPMFIRETEMTDVHDVGDLIIAKILKTGRNSIDLTLKSRGLGKIKDGIIIEINPNRVPRVIGKEGSMIKLIKTASNTEITVGQNGIIWIKGDSKEEELFAKAAIEYVAENTLQEGLTEKVEEWLKKNKKAEIKKETE